MELLHIQAPAEELLGDLAVSTLNNGVYILDIEITVEFSVLTRDINSYRHEQ